MIHAHIFQEGSTCITFETAIKVHVGNSLTIKPYRYNTVKMFVYDSWMNSVMENVLKFKKFCPQNKIMALHLLWGIKIF